MRSAARSGWLAVIGSALGLSTWSLMFTAHKLGVPLVLAAVVSTCFDGAALTCAALSMNAALRGDTGTGPRMAVFGLVGLSAYLNGYHAVLIGAPRPAIALYSSPPVISVLLLEFRLREQRQAAIRAAGRAVDPMPVFGMQAWFRHLFLANRAMQEISRHRIEEKVRSEAFTFAAALNQADTKADCVRMAVTGSGSDDPANVLAWLTRNAHYVPDKLQGFSLAYVTQCLNRDAARLAATEPAAIETGSSGYAEVETMPWQP